MRILVVGAGAIGGYFGAKLLKQKRDVTFLVRPNRAAQLKSGLKVISWLNEIHVPAPDTVLAGEISESFDLILLSCKAYDLTPAIQSFAPAVTDRTTILPLLNGMRHIDILSDCFGSEKIIGGQTMLSSTLNESGHIIQLNKFDTLTFGELERATSDRINNIISTFGGAGFEIRPSPNVVQEMWEKWTFIATLAGATCLLRASIGDIVSAAASHLILSLFDECLEIADENGFRVDNDFVETRRAILTTPSSTLKSSMLRDIERGAEIEGSHIIDDLLGRSAKQRPLLTRVSAHLAAYRAQRLHLDAEGPVGLARSLAL